MSHPIAIFLAAVGGAILPLQFLINARLSQGMGNAFWATTISFIVGTVGLLAFIVVSRQSSVNWEGTLSLPWWAWVGGLLGAVYVSLTIITVPIIGPTALVVLMILGQMVAGTALEYFGVLTEPQPIAVAKIFGLVLVAAGTWLVVKS